MFEYAMPSLGADMESGTLLAWYVKPGDVVVRGQIVGLVDTEKAEIEIEIWTPGRVERVLVEPGREVPVGTPLLALSESTATTTPPASTRPPPPIPSTRPTPSPATRPATSPITKPSATAGGPATAATVAATEVSNVERPSPTVDARAERIRATPLARRLARERAIDLATLQGTGPEGRIRADDVARAESTRTAERPTGGPTAAGGTTPVATPPVSPMPGAAPSATTPTVPSAPLSPDRLAAIARGMAAAMSRSKREIPHYYLALDVDLSAALAWLERANRERPISERLLLQVLLLKATAKALAEVPELNGHWLDDRFVPASSVHLGVAIAVRGGGLLAPALHDVERRDLDDLMRGLSDLVARTRRAQLRGAEVRDATATVSSLADRGPDRLYGVIYPPQVALVGFGGVRERPWAENGLLGVRPVLTVTLAADHRASDGLRGTRLLRRLARALAEPETLA